MLLLVDGGSTHNFIQQHLVSQLGLACCATQPLKVMVGNGQQLECQWLCEAISIELQTISVTVDLYVLPIVDANVIIGVQWLKSLGPMLTNYAELTMQFFYNGALVELRGDKDTQMGLITPPQLRRLCRKPEGAICFHISVIAEDIPSSSSPTWPPELHALLLEFRQLFQNLQSLPPPRTTDHHIHLLPQATPVNVRPYRYPHYQKQEIELQVEMML